jgi:hypothetical protein
MCFNLGEKEGKEAGSAGGNQLGVDVLFSTLEEEPQRVA